MTYKFEVSIKPGVNHATKSAEVSVIDHNYNGSGKGIVVMTKHIAKCDNPELAAENFCIDLHTRVCVFVKQELAYLSDAKP